MSDLDPVRPAEDPEEHEPTERDDPEEFDLDDRDPELAGRGQGEDVEEIDDAWVPTAEDPEGDR